MIKSSQLGGEMIILLKRADLRDNVLAADKIRLHHTLLHQSAIEAAELIVLTEHGKVYVLRSTKWPAGKQILAAELLKYIAEHAV
jgi:hypothetical protein